LEQHQEEAMISKVLASALLATVLFTSAAGAQTVNKDQSDKTVSSHKDGEWRSSKVIGLNVYNDAKEKVGEIEEIIIDKSGRVANVVLGVGGFLGMGEHYVAVPMDKLKWVNEAVSNTNTAATSTVAENKPTVGTTDKGTVTGEVNRSNRPMRAGNEMWYPDHAIYNVSKDELKKMPQFKYN
jgi:sporulation protein YlmC with PRC-barrel domain